MRAAELDRVSPQARPDRAPSGHQEWRNLLFVHWSYPLDVIRPLVPAQLELDAWDGRVFVGAVPFEMQGIRLAHTPRWSGMEFLETNLRTYVHYRGQPGVFFFSLEASSKLAVRAARWGWGLPYFDATMRSEREADGTFAYETTRARRGARLFSRFRPGAPLGPSEPGTLQHFLLERYYLFSHWRGAIWRGQVHHVPYPARAVEVDLVDETLTRAAGLPAHGAQPETAHFSAGVDVDVFGPDRLG